jgi:ADP-ribose pyrophosphatase YjhB (NUDIX family)
MSDDPRWLRWARELQALAQAGLTFSRDKYDLERYRRLRQIASELFEQGTGTPIEQISALFEQEQGYPTPKVDVRGAVFEQQRILLVREISDGCWTLPGGWADVNQTPRECVEREIYEESGFHARARKLAAVWDAQRSNGTHHHAHSIYKLFFICERTGGAAQPSMETSEVGFFGQQELPPLSLGRVTERQIERMFAHYADPELPAEFE